MPVAKLGRLMDDGLRDYKGPIGRLMMSHFEYQVSGVSREGYMLSRSSIDRAALLYGGAATTEMCFMNIVEELKSNYEEVSQLWDAYKERLAAFRNEVKNDVSSLEAAARRTTEGAVKINKSYAEVFAQLNGEEMRLAIDNAERLARALDAIAHLQSHRMTFAVVDAQRVSDSP